jgi:alanyl-tRNA synthetase
VGDHGTIVSQKALFDDSEKAQFDVMDTSRPFPNLIVHKGLVTSGTFKVGDRIALKVHTGIRRSIMANHSATHLLQWALRQSTMAMTLCLLTLEIDMP